MEVVGVAEARDFGKTQLRVPLEQGLQRNLQFKARERRADAEMDPGAERHIFLVGPLRTKGLRLGEGKRVMIGHAKQKPYRLARPYDDAG